MASEATTIGLESVREVQEAYEKLRGEIRKVIVGQDEVVEQMLLAIFCRGHAVVVGVPGLAKTLLISTIARSLSLGFSRIQFTPDLMPSDITGTEVIQEDKLSGQRVLRFVKGPVFSNVILADEINRTPPKTQAALLEAMQERQVTVGGQRHELPRPFFNMNEEMEIVRRTATKGMDSVKPVLDEAAILHLQETVRAMPVPDHVISYALRLVRATRVKEPMDIGLTRPTLVNDYVGWGAGPRASEFLVLAAKAAAAVTGSTHVTADHVRHVAAPVLRHRIMLNFNAEADQISPDDIIKNLLENIPVEGLTPDERKKMDEVLR